MKHPELCLAVYDGRAAIQNVPRERKVPRLVIELDHAFSVPACRNLPYNNRVKASSTRTDFSIGIEAVYLLLGPSLYLAGLGIAAFVEINPRVAIFFAEDEADAIRAVCLAGNEGFLDGPPGLGVRAVRQAPGPRVIGQLGCLSVALPKLPVNPLRPCF